MIPPGRTTSLLGGTASILALLLLLLVSALSPASAFGRARTGSTDELGVAHPVLHHREIRAHASVVGGRLAEPGSFPWLAYVADFVGEYEISCTGTVVAPNLVLTAAHCVENSETGEIYEPGGYRIVTGNVDWASPEHLVSGVSSVIVYPNYHPSGTFEGWGDAALLVLSTPTGSPAIRLATSEIWRAGTEAVIDGWGDTYYGQESLVEQLNWAETVVQGKSWCSANAPGFHPLAQICTIDAPTYESGTCHGDSGGPLIAQPSPSEEWVEIGIAYAVYGECLTTSPDLFTRADLVSSWVGARIAELDPPTAAPPPAPAPTPSPPTPAAPAPSEPAQPPAQPRLPTMTATEARHYAREGLTAALFADFVRHRDFHAACRSVGSTVRRCGVRWTEGTTVYFGSVTTYYVLRGADAAWNDEYRIHSVESRCPRGRRAPCHDVRLIRSGTVHEPES